MSQPPAPRHRRPHVALQLALIAALCAPLRANDLLVPSANFATIQSAVDAAQEGDRVVVMPGTYHETIGLVDKTSIELIGKKGATIDSEGISAVAIGVFSCTDIRIEGLTLVNAVYGLVVFDSSRSVVERVTVSGASNASGIEILNGSGNLVTDCRVQDCFGGVALEGPMAHAATRNHVQDVTQNGFSAFGSGHVIAGNTVTGAGAIGVLVGNNTDATVRVLVEGNKFSGIGGSAIQFGATAEACVLRSNVILGGSDGVLLQTGASGIVVEGNRLVGTSGPGIRVQSGASLQATGNRILKAGQHGVLIEAGAGECLLADNRIVAPAQDGVLVEAGASPARIDRNQVNNAGHFSLTIFADECSLVFNRMKGPGYAYAQDTVLIGNVLTQKK